MAQKINVELVDDLDGTPAVETVVFGLDGKTYELDLNEKNAARLRKNLDRFVGNARKVTTGRVKTRRTRAAAANLPTPTHTAPVGPTSREIREWAQAQGMEVSTRGVVKSEIRELYLAAH